MHTNELFHYSHLFIYTYCQMSVKCPCSSPATLFLQTALQFKDRDPCIHPLSPIPPPAASVNLLACLISLCLLYIFQRLSRQSSWGILWKIYFYNCRQFIKHMLLSFHHLLKCLRERQNSLVSFFHLALINTQGEGKSCFCVCLFSYRN